MCVHNTIDNIAGFSLKHGITAPRRSVKSVNKVGAVNYKEHVTYKRTIVRSYTRYMFTP